MHIIWKIIQLYVFVAGMVSTAISEQVRRYLEQRALELAKQEAERQKKRQTDVSTYNIYISYKRINLSLYNGKINKCLIVVDSM